MQKPSRLTTGLVFASSLFVAAAALSTVTPHQTAEAAPRSSDEQRASAATRGEASRLGLFRLTFTTSVEGTRRAVIVLDERQLAASQLS